MDFEQQWTNAANTLVALVTTYGLRVVGAVIIFPWLFTLWMSAFDWKIGSSAHFVRFGNYEALATNQRFAEAILHTFYFTVLAVILWRNFDRKELLHRVCKRGKLVGAHGVDIDTAGQIPAQHHEWIGCTPPAPHLQCETAL